MIIVRVNAKSMRSWIVLHEKHVSHKIHYIIDTDVRLQAPFHDSILHPYVGAAQ